jgi:hypothetical protein
VGPASATIGLQADPNSPNNKTRMNLFFMATFPVDHHGPAGHNLDMLRKA